MGKSRWRFMDGWRKGKDTLEPSARRSFHQSYNHKCLYKMNVNSNYKHCTTINIHAEYNQKTINICNVLRLTDCPTKVQMGHVQLWSKPNGKANWQAITIINTNINDTTEQHHKQKEHTPLEQMAISEKCLFQSWFTHMTTSACEKWNVGEQIESWPVNKRIVILYVHCQENSSVSKQSKQML